MPLRRGNLMSPDVSNPSQEPSMTTDQRIARRKLSLLELAQDLGNVSKACKLVGYSRQQFYEIRRNYQTYGAAGLIDKVKGRSSTWWQSSRGGDGCRPIRPP